MRKILVLGRPLTDIEISTCPEKYLESQRFRYLDAGEARSFLADVKGRFSCGGAGLNSAYERTLLGVPAIYLGSTGNDERSHDIEKYLDRAGVTNVIFRTEGEMTGFTALSTLNGRRGLFHYGASDFPQTRVVQYVRPDILFTESYLFSSPKAPEIMDIYRKHDQSNVLTLTGTTSSAQEQTKTMIEELIDDRACDVLLGNSSEFKEMFKEEDMTACARRASEKVRQGVITMGPKGSIVFSDRRVVAMPPYAHLQCGTLGDGDAYAGGFISGLARDIEIEDCGRLGSYASFNKIMRNVRKAAA